MRGGTDMGGTISPDDLELFFASYRSGAFGSADIYVTTRATPADPWGPPVNLGPTINTAGEEVPMAISPDGLVLFVGSKDLPGGFGSYDTWMIRRPYKGAAWSEPVNLGPSVNTPQGEILCSLSPDGQWAYISEYDGAPKGDLWMAPIIPIVDFNGDGIVDIDDLFVLIDHWGQADSGCDIGPFAWGDGTVDVQDLKVLAEYIGKEIEDPTLVAHWAFDETEGTLASDSAGDNDGTVVAGATWQPQGGMVGGALQCDGVTGYVVTKSIPDLGGKPFSVIAWVKGGTPGEIILCHNGATDWLLANPIDGSLMTKLTSAGRPLAQGFSDVIITDGKGHRIALVWDGANRSLYADGKEVARDAQPGITIPSGPLMIGASRDPGTHWSGLIDDVRIYNRAVEP